MELFFFLINNTIPESKQNKNPENYMINNLKPSGYFVI